MTENRRTQVPAGPTPPHRAGSTADDGRAAAAIVVTSPAVLVGVRVAELARWISVLP